MTGRILAIDYGKKRTGIAVTDPLRIIAGGIDTVATGTLLDYIEKYLEKNNVSIIVVGKPLRLDGTPSETYAGAEGLVAKIKAKFPMVTVDFYDERFTTALAHRAILEGGVKKMDRRDKALADKISAAIILQGYLDSAQYQKIKEKL